VKAFFDGQVFVPLTPIKVKKNQFAIVTVIDNSDYKQDTNAYLAFAGALSDEDYLELSTIQKDNERVDINEW